VVQFLSIFFFSVISSIFVGFFKSSLFLCHLYFAHSADCTLALYSILFILSIEPRDILPTAILLQSV